MALILKAFIFVLLTWNVAAFERTVGTHELYTYNKRVHVQVSQNLLPFSIIKYFQYVPIFFLQENMDQRFRTIEETVKRMGIAFREEIRQVSEEKDALKVELEETKQALKRQEEMSSRLVKDVTKMSMNSVYSPTKQSKGKCIRGFQKKRISLYMYVRCIGVKHMEIPLTLRIYNARIEKSIFLKNP